MSKVLPVFGDDQILPQIYPKSGRFCHSFKHPDEKDAEFVWGIAQQTAVNQLKVMISHHPALHTANFYTYFNWRTEVSGIALRAQETDGSHQPTACAL
jgi:hypothetical protein